MLPNAENACTVLVKLIGYLSYEIQSLGRSSSGFWATIMKTYVRLNDICWEWLQY